MNKEIAAKAKYLKAENKKWPAVMTRVPVSSWPPYPPGGRAELQMVLRSSDFLAQVFKEGPQLRISINRTRLNAKGEWDDGITWVELQKIKSECGFGSMQFVEIYPADDNVVNVANMRHLWLLPVSVELGWKRKEQCLS